MRKSNLRQRGLAALLSGALALSSFPAAMPVMAAGKDVRSITSLKTNGLVNPIGVDNKKPVFNWIMETDTRGAKQTAYQIVVKDMDGQKMWDSGKVPSGESANIEYAGTELKAKAKYQWQVTVTDEKGKTWTSETNTFETSFLDTGYTSWGDAQWIGAEDKNIDASMADLFDMHMDMQLGSDTKKASVVFGADDFRLQNKAMNVWGKGGENAENYFRYEVDLTDSTKPKLNIYVVGMPTRVKGTDSSGKETWVTQNTENDPAEPDITVDIPSTVFDNNVSGTNAPQASADKPISVRIWTPSINTVSCSLNGVEVDSKRQLNPLGGNHNSNSFPNLNSIGFAVPAGGTAEYSNIELVNSDVARETLLFSQNDGATYEIFNGLENVTVAADEDLITVKGAAETGTLVYKDPSYGSSPMVRHAFSTNGRVVKNARLYVSAQGTYEMFINGTKVSDGLFNPGNEEYSTSMPYQVYDVTGLLKTGDNAIGAQLGQGWWSGELNYTTNDYDYYGTHQALLARMDITYADDTSETIFTNPDDWKVSTSGPVRYESHYHGERYDGRIDQTYSGWSTASYTETADWKKPVVHTPKMNNFHFVVRYDEEASVVKELNVVKALGEAKTGTGSYIYDMGENVIGVPQITIPKEYVDEGDTVTVRYAEILYPDLQEYREDGLVGSMMVENLRAALCTDFYIANDQAVQVFEPHFTFHGYRYIEISGLKKELPAANIKTEVISSVKMTATYDSSNANVNRLFKNVQNSQTSNFLSLPTDCPQRNERLGWTGDAQVFSMAASYNADVYNFYRNWLKSLRACQRGDGSLPPYAPTAEPRQEKYVSGFQGVSWDAALIAIPYNMYMQTGNPAIISDNMEAIDTYLDYLDGGDLSETYTHLTNHTGMLADWLSIDSTDAALINNAVYVYLIGLTRDMAEIIGDKTMEEKYAKQYDLAKAEWNQCYMDTNGKTKTTQSEGRGGIVTYENNTEAAYATPLRYGVVSDELIDKAVANYVQTVKDAGYTITSGFSGTPNLVPVLTQYGYVEDAYKLFEQTKYASWLYPVTQGATSVWERWNSYTVEGGFNGNNSMNSFNHFSLGAISEWMMSYQLGITRDAGKAGYKEFVLQPVAGGSFTYAKGSYESNYGTIYSGWTAEDGKMTSYQATVPANTTATLYLPITEAQADALKAPEGATFAGMEARNGMECAKYALESGEYNFQISMAREITDLKDQVGNLQDQADELQKKADELQKKADDLQKAAEQAEAKAKTDASARADAEAKAQAAEKARAEAETARKAAEDAAAKAKAAQVKAETSLAKNQFKAKKVSLKTVKSSKKKTAAVTWNKVSGAGGYQIQYSTKSNFKGAKKITIKKGSTTKTTIKKLKSGKKYYFRIRAYKKIGGSNQYTSYSAKKSVKIK